MSVRTRVFSAVTALAILALLIAIAIRGAGDEMGAMSLFTNKKTINVWYSDDALTDFFKNVAVSYNESQSEYRIEPKLIKDTDYLEAINDASVKGDDFPDVYVLGNDSLERATLAGLTSAVTDTAYFSDNVIYPQSAINAVAYGGKIVAYPMSYETAAFIYNTQYLQSMASDLGQSLEQTVPKTMVDVINLANSYNAPEGVEAVLKWDVSNIFLNYAFVGNYLTLGSLTGDASDQINLYNSDSIQCLQVFQQLNDFFSVDTESDDYENIISDFADGKLVFTFATTDICMEMQRRQQAGENFVEYGVTTIPDATSSLLSKSMNVTDCLVVNGYSENIDAANRFVRYLLFEKMDGFYEQTGKAPAMKTYQYFDTHMYGFADAYDDSVPITKLRAASTFWMLLENTFANVWSGKDPNEELRSMQQQMMVQITGDDNYTVDAIPDPERINLSAELTGGD